jgi:tRNA (guanosine-2'-O-)-methyltransferase
MQSDLILFLSKYITEQRRNQFQKVLKHRTRYITVVLEDIYQTHNASAVLRSCDCFGIQDVHIIENRNKFEINKDIALGSGNWLTIHKYNQADYNTLSAINYLKSQDYRVVATSPDSKSAELPDFDLSKGKVALLFGAEKDGLTEDVFRNVDECLKIPMFGFTGSFNISVSVAIILYQLTLKLRETGIEFELSLNEMEEIELQWLRSSIKKSKLIEKEFYNRLKT